MERLRLCICGFASLFGLAGFAFADAPVGLEALYRIDQLAALRPYTWAYQCSSYDRGSRNYDWTGFLGWNGTEKIVLDVKGAGCIYRMWFTANNNPLDGTLRIYFDGSSTPAVQIPMEQFFSGAHPWFPAPLVGNRDVSSGGYYCYVPMAFRTGCRITHTNSADLTYYNITYHRYVTADGVSTFGGSQATAALKAQWNSAGGDPKPNDSNQAISGSRSVPAGGFTTLASLTGSGIVQRIELNLPTVSQEWLSGLRLRIAWDGLGSAVDAPIGSFFGAGLAPGTVNGLPIGMNGGRLYCYFPMPFRTQAQIYLDNTSATVTGDIGYVIEYLPATVPANVGRFYADHAQRQRLPEGLDYNFVTVGGTGQLVGVVQTSRGRVPGQWYLEGDERIYVDGALTPALHGTGTEDFYNGGWYFERGLFTRPLHGHTAHTVSADDMHANSCYRFLIGDMIPFRDVLRAGIEHGGWNEDPVNIESVAFYYKSPRSTLFLADDLDVGTADSEAAHGYARTNEVWAGTITAEYRGNGDSVSAVDAGRWLGLGGTSRFTITTNPPGSYVVLRRRLDYSVPRQQADVRVNGVYGGTWYDAGSNATDGSRNVKSPSFRDSDFFIPPALAHGGTSLDVEIVNTSTESEWTEYRYWVYIVHDGSAAPADFDYDGDVDQEDFAFLQQCMSGDLVAPSDPRCRAASLDGDADVDEADAAIFLNCMTGVGVLADTGCADR